MEETVGLSKGMRLSPWVFSFLLSSALADPASEIAAAHDSFIAAFNAQDAAGVAAHFTEDAIALSPGWKVVEGRDGVEKMYTAFFEAGFHDLEGESLTLDVVSDEVAIEIYLDSAYNIDKEGMKKQYFFKVLDVWRHDDDGAWRIHRTSFNPRPDPSR